MLAAIVALMLTLDQFSDCPPLRDIERLPPTWVIDESRRVANLRESHLQFRLSMRPWCDHTGEEWREAKRTTEAIDAMWSAACMYYCPDDKRRALKRLRGLIGDEAFYRGEWPNGLAVGRLEKR